MIIGIDLGTTYSLGATLSLDGTPTLLPDTTNRNIFYTPSILNINGNNAFVGLSVLHMLEQNPNLEVLRFFKRHLGNPTLLYSDNKEGASWYPEAVAALVLKKIKYDAEIFSSSTVEGAVITVPAHFTDVQRKAVLNAAAMIDLPVKGLLEEPVAAALHYGVSTKSHDQNILVYDFGGGTFDVTLLSMNEKGVFVIGKDGISDLGGKEFDEKISLIIHEQFEQATGKEVNFSGRQLQQLRVFSEEIKVELSNPGVNYISRVCLLGNESIEAFVTRKDFEKAITPDIDRTISILHRCLKSTGLRPDDVDVLLLVGGSSMVPFVKQYLTTAFPKLADKIKFHDPMKAVAFGAAIYVRMLNNEDKTHDLPPELKGVTGYNLAIRALNPETGRIFHDILIKKNRPLPQKIKKTYYTGPSNQGKMRVELVQFIDEDDIKTLGTLNVGPLPSNESNYPIEITMEYTEDNLILLQAFDPKTGHELEKTFGKEGMDANYLANQKKIVQRTFINNII
jgi:molecular chaperone DnaK (HSP70)